LRRCSRNGSIIKPCINLCWFFFKWSTALAIIAALVATPFYYRKIFYRVEEEIRLRVEAKIAEQMPHLKVQVRSVHLSGDGIEVRGLSISERDALGPQPELIYVDEMFLACSTSPQEFIAGEPVVTRVTLRHPIARATRRPDGTYSISKLFPLPKPQGVAPPATIEDGIIEIFDPLKNPSSNFTLREINLSIKPNYPAQDRLLLDVEGSLAADLIQRVEVAGTIDPEKQQWAFSGTVDGMEISPELRTALPEQISAPMEPLASLRAPARLTFRASRASSSESAQFEINGSVSRGRIDDPRLPFPLSDLRASIHCDNSGFQIFDLSTRHGQTVWEISQLDRRGYELDSPLTLQASGKQVRLDRTLGNAIPQPWRTDYRNYDPDGEVNIDCKLQFDGKRWTPAVRLTCLSNVSFSCHKFPYRLEHTQGTLTLNGNRAHVDLVAYSGAQPVTLKGTFHDPGPRFTGQIEIRGDKIPFDEKLFAALLIKPKAHETIRSLQPQGTFNFKTTLWREDPRIKEIHQVAEVTVNRCSMNYEKFPYPLSNLEGMFLLRDGQWEFRELVASNGTGSVLCPQGTLKTSPEGDVLSMVIHATNIPLGEDLREALRPNEQRLWDSMQPRGSVNFQVGLGYDSRTKKTAIDLRVYPREDATSIGTSIEPVSFPYRMQKLKGCIHYRDGHVELEQMKAVHGTTQMTTDGSCDFLPNGSWRLQLKRLEVERFRLQGADQDLVAALPEALRHAICELRPTGTLKLKGNLDFVKQSPTSPLKTNWDVDVYLNQGDLQVGPKLEHIFGRVHLTGGSDGTRFSSGGNLFFDSLSYKNFQFTEVFGPIWFNNENCYLGAVPREVSTQAPAHVTAKLFGGVITGDGHVRLGNLPQYQLTASITGADLGQFARENLANHQKLNGKVLANINLRGSRGSHNLFGTGDIHLTEADIYELPVTVALLKIVRAKRPDSTAFTQSDIQFQLNGEHLLLNQIDLRGDAVSLLGQGEITLDSMTNPINLEFNTTVGRGNIPLLSGMFDLAGQQIMKIHVEGSLDQPKTRTDAFPVATQALERLRADYDGQKMFPPSGGIMQTLSPNR